MIEFVEFIVGFVLIAVMYSMFVVIPYALAYKAVMRLRKLFRGG